ncbi:MAG: glycosyltransferase family 2 protein [Xanthobacteraceae bacterium]|nr:glycosyltransferase family 2 protein [Xanthobacteraceae bacterium]
MRVELYAQCWNEAERLGFLFRHYDPIVDRYVIYDDGSDDGSIEILRRHPKVDLRRLPPYSDPTSRLLSDLNFLNNVWYESRGVADWVLIADIDEHFYHPNLTEYLRDCHQLGVTLIPALGYQMISNIFPEPADLLLSASLSKGAPWWVMSKLGFFAPDRIQAINYGIGRHTCTPSGRLMLPPRDELLLLHYKYLDLDRTHRRHESLGVRSRENDIANGFGHKYFWSKDQLAEEWHRFEAQLVDISDPSIDHHSSHQGPRWWACLPRVQRG